MLVRNISVSRFRNMCRSAYAVPLALLFLLAVFYAFGAPASSRLFTTILPYYFYEGILLSTVCVWFRIPIWVIVLVLASTLLQVAFLYDSNIYTSAPDVTGHIHYVEHLLAHSFIPPVPIFFQPAQPPLFFWWCASWYKIGEWVGAPDLWHVVRLSVRALYLGYVVLSMKLIEQLRLPFLAKLSAVLIALFWPTAHLLSVRFNNDIGFMFLFMATMVSIMQWRETLSYKHLACAMICSGLSVLAKATGVMGVLTVAAAIGQYLLNGRITLRYIFNRSFWWGVLGLAICLAGYFGRIAYYRMAGEDLWWFANVHDGQGQYGPLYLPMLIQGNPLEFVTHPDLDWGLVWAGQHTFWGYLFRTMLYSPTYLRELVPSSLVNGSWLAVMIIAIWQARPRKLVTEDSNRADLLMLAVVVMLVLYIWQRVIVPDINISYGRRIQPITVLIACLAALTLKEQFLKGRRVLYLMGSAICITMGVASLRLASNDILAPYLPIF